MKTSLTTCTRSLFIFAAGIGFGAAGVAIGATALGSDVFPDIARNAYYDSAVGELSGLGIIKGNPDGLYHPERPVSRAEIAVLLKRLRDDLLGKSLVDSSGSSPSVTPPRTTTRPVTTVETPSDDGPAAREVNPAGSVRFTIGEYHVDEGDGTATVSFIRTGGKEGAVELDYEFIEGTAKGGDDFVLASGRLTFAHDESSRTLNVRIMDDALVETDETFTIKLKDPKGGVTIGTPGTATIVIKDDDGSDSDSDSGTSGGDVKSIAFAAQEYRVAEDGGSFTVTVVRRGGTGSAMSVSYETRSGTASSPTDFDATEGTLSFAAHEVSKTFEVKINDDAKVEGNETFSLALKNQTAGVVLEMGIVPVIIVDTDRVPYGSGSLRLSDEAYTVDEDGYEAMITVERIGGADGVVSVGYKTTGGSATKGTDYLESKGTLTFAHGESIKVFYIRIVDDKVVDPYETVTLAIEDPQGTTIEGTRIATLTIEDDD